MKVRGFTLLDTLIVVAVIGILAALALPGYQFYISQSKLDGVRLALLELQSEQEKHRLSNKTYATASELSLPPTDVYAFSVENVSVDSYRLVAKHKDVGVPCAVISIDESFNRSPQGCWE